MERENYYQRFLAGEDIAVLAAEAGIPPQTLSRRLRELRQFAGTPSRERPPTVVPTAPTTNPPPAAGQVYVLANPTDAHGVYADPYAWELALKCIEAMRPDHITWGNDAMDFGMISSFAKTGPTPSVREEKDDEKLRRKELLSAAPGAALWWIADNHTLSRYTRYIFNKAPELAELEELSFHQLFDLKEEQIIESFEAGDTLRVIHGSVVRKWPGLSVTAEIFDSPGNRKGRLIKSVMMGHVHRFAHVVFDNGLEGLECGCLQDLRPDWMKADRKSTNWAHGLGFARYTRDWSQLIPARFLIQGDRLVCRLEGKEYSVKIGPSYSGFN